MVLKQLVVCALLVGSTDESFGGPDSIPTPTQTTNLDRATKLIERSVHLADVKPKNAKVAAVAALLVETNDVPASLLVAIAWGESRFEPATITGRACGLVQTIGASRRECEWMTVPIVGMRAGVVELETWLRVTRGNLELALLAYACGNSAFDGTCKKTAWPGWVLARARKLGLRKSRLTT